MRILLINKGVSPLVRIPAVTVGEHGDGARGEAKTEAEWTVIAFVLFIITIIIIIIIIIIITNDNVVIIIIMPSGASHASKRNVSCEARLLRPLVYPFPVLVFEPAGT